MTHPAASTAPPGLLPRGRGLPAPAPWRRTDPDPDGHPWTRPFRRRARDDAVAARRAPPRRPPRRWRVLLWRARLPFAATMLGCAVALGLADLRPPPPPRTAVVVTAHALDAGTALTDADVDVVHLPPDAVADGAHREPGAVVGRALVVAVPAGLPVVDALLRDDRLASAGPPGTVVVPVRLADPGVADLLRPGDRVDLLAAATSSTGTPVAEVLARRALVLPHPAPSDGPDPGGLLGSAPTDTGTLTLVAVDPAQAPALAGAAAWAGISAVVVE